MKKMGPILCLALLILSILYSLEFVLIRSRLNREAARLSRMLHDLEDRNRSEAKLYFMSIPLLEKAGKLAKTHPGFLLTSYSEIGIPKVSDFPPLLPNLEPRKTRLLNGASFWIKTRWVDENGKLWAETLGSARHWPANPGFSGAPIFGLAAPVPQDFFRIGGARMAVVLTAAWARNPRGLTIREVTLPDRDPGAPNAFVRYRVGPWTHGFLMILAWLLLMGSLRLLRARPAKSGKRETQLEEELAYLSKTYQNLSKSLRMERQKVEAILNSAPDGIFTCSPEGSVTFWNRSMENLTQLSKEMAVGKHYRDNLNIFSAEGQLLAEPFSATFHQHQTLSLLDCQLEALGVIRLNGANFILPVALGAAPVTTPDGPVEEIVITVKDIRQQKKAEELREDMQAMITHDLRSPLAAMLGYAGLIQNAKIRKNEEDAQKYLESLVRAGKEMLILISNLLGWSWVEEGKLTFQKESLEIAPILKETAESLGVLAKPKSLSIAVGAPDDLWALTDGSKLKEILNNLVTNAIKFSRPGGTVRVTAGEEETKVRISVADQGPGIPPEECKNLFKKFSNLRKPGSGTGLGLYIVKTLAEAMDGSVEVESEAGHGSVFSILIPAVQRARTRSKQLSFASLVASGDQSK